MEIALIILFFSLWIWTFFLIRPIYRVSENYSIIKKAIARSSILTLAFGVGIIGGEGFGLPGPLFGALFFFNGMRFYTYTAIIPAIFWFFLFFIFQYWKLKYIYEEDKHPMQVWHSKGIPNLKYDINRVNIKQVSEEE